MVENINIVGMQYYNDLVNSILIKDLDSLLIIDTGIKEGKDTLLNEILKNDFKKLFVVLTHGHPDHLGNNFMLKENFNPIFISNAFSKKMIEDYEYQFKTVVGKASDHYEITDKLKNSYFNLLDKEIKVDILFHEEMYLNFGNTELKILNLPGHTIGDIGIIDKKNKTLILSELLFKHSRNMIIYIDDFNKYSKRVPPDRLHKTMMTVPRLIGQKFMYSNVDRAETSKALKQALELLCGARICHKINHSAARGVPLAAQENEKKFKVIFLDTGLVSAIQGIVLKSKKEIRELIRINSGGISEQAVGQMLRASTMKLFDPHLNYFVRENKGSEAEIDYLIQHEASIIPIEVKSGATGSLKSLHQFMSERNFKKAVRINSEKPVITNINTKTGAGGASAGGGTAEYSLISIPFYLTEEVDRFI